MRGLLLLALVALALAATKRTNTNTNTNTVTAPAGVTMTRTLTVYKNTANVVGVQVVRAQKRGSARIAGDRFAFEFRTTPIARVLFQYWRAEGKSAGSAEVSTSRINFRFAFWNVIHFNEQLGSDNLPVSLGFDENDTVLGTYRLWAAQGNTGLAWRPITDTLTGTNQHELNGTTTNGGFSFSLHCAEQDFLTRRTGAAVFSSDSTKIDVEVKPRFLFGNTNVNNNPNSKIALLIRFVAKTTQATWENKTRTTPPTQNDVTLGDALTEGAFVGLDYSFDYATTESGALVTGDNAPLLPSPNATVSPWFPLSANQESEDSEKQDGDRPYLFYVTFNAPLKDAARIEWDPTLGLSGGDMGSSASSVTVSVLLFALALVAMLL
jgi:hypothetical protein